MARRISKKVLIGLTSTIAFGATGLITGLGVKSIINNHQRSVFLDAINPAITDANLGEFPNYNVATKDMFVDTTNLTSFHAGNIQQGQMVTPYGWLGLFNNPDNPNVRYKIALTGWNGEVLWVNDDYESNQSDPWANVYELKYDWNSNLVFVVRTSSRNGLVDNPKQKPEVKIDLLDAITGVKKRTISLKWNLPIGSTLEARFGNVFTKNNNDYERGKNLYSLEVTSSRNKLVLTYAPNFMQLYDKMTTTGDSRRSLVSLPQIIDNWSYLTKSFSFSLNNDGEITSQKEINVNPNLSQELKRWFYWGKQLNKRDFNILVNPFFTLANDNNLVMHLIVANHAGQILHKIIGFTDSNSVVTRYDRTEEWTRFLSIKANEWFNGRTWSKDFINANLKVNKNMFDSNLAVFAYPYAASQNASNNFPLFNVAQILIDGSTGMIVRTNNTFRRPVNYDVGKQIYDFWKTNPNNNKINPWPNAKTGYTNLNHNYNRLMSVSPFDNTFIYAASQNFNNGTYDGSDAKKNDWASFWIGISNKGPSKYFPLVIGNESSNPIHSSMMNIDDIYQSGFSFDLKSLFIPRAGDVSLNLYFNQTGTGKSQLYNNPEIKTSKIGLLDDVIKMRRNNGWKSNIASDQMGFSDFKITVNENSFATLIYSKAKLEKWYPRTWKNLNVPSNLYAANEVINENVNQNDKVIVNKFNERMIDTQFNSQKAVDLYSHWQVGSSQNVSNKARLVFESSKIQVLPNSKEKILPLATTYILDDTIKNKKEWMPSNKTKLTYTRNRDLTNPSFKVFSSWSNQIKMQTMSGNTESANLAANFGVDKTPAWFDKRQQNQPTITGNNLFGHVNNNIDLQVDGQSVKPLRLLFKIVEPTTKPNWFNQIPSTTFDYFPLNEDKLDSETSFESVLQNYVNLKTQNIDLDQDHSNSPVGLANLKIEAKVDLNPKIAADHKIYKNPIDNKKMIYLANSEQQIFYEDSYSGSHLIYDQSSLTFNDANNWGFGSKAQINESWQTKPSTKFKSVVDLDLIKDTLVRNAENDQQPIFSFKYKNMDHNALIVTPTDMTWFKSHFSNFNQLLNLFVVFEYQSETDSKWKTLDTKNNEFNDDKFKQILTNGNFEIPVAAFDIKKIRVKLVEKSDDENTFIEFKNFDQNQNKLISAEVQLEKRWIDVNKDWFNQEVLASGKFVNELTQEDLNDYENRIFGHSQMIQKMDYLKERIKIIYSFNSQENLSSSELLTKMNQYQTDYNNSTLGFLKLWNGNDGIKISAKFAKVDISDQNTTFVDSSGQELQDDQLSNDVNTTKISTKVDLTKLTEWLETIFVDVKQKTKSIHQIQSLEMPDYQGNDQHFNNQKWTKIEQALESLGIKIQYKKSLSTNQNNATWDENLSSIDQYDSTIGQFQIKFVLKRDEAKNLIVPITENESLDLSNRTESHEIKVNLNVTLDVTINNTFVDKFIKDENNISGNTKFLKINKTNLDQLKKEIIQENVARNPLYSKLNENLKILFTIGDNSDWLEVDQFIEKLAQSQEDQTSNKIKFKFSIQGSDKFAVDSQDHILSQEQIGSKDAKIKIYINEKGLEKLASQIKVVGNNEKFTYQWPSGFEVDSSGKVNNTPGLKIQYTTNPKLGNQEYDSSQSNNDPKKNWVDQQVTSFDVVDHYLAIQLVATDGYIYAPQYKGEHQENLSWSVHQVNMDDLRLMINLKKDWLKLIAITGNTKNISIQDEQMLIYMQSQNIQPNDDQNLVQLEYSIDGQTWFDKEGFKTFLFAKHGAKNEANFIIKREDLKVRYTLKPAVERLYQMKIDNTEITQTDRDQFNYQLVDSTINKIFKGYLNVDNLGEFKLENFAVVGSITKPIFELKKRNHLESLLKVYAKDNLFDILFATEKNDQNQWVFEPEHKLMKSDGSLLQPHDLIDQNITLSHDKVFAIKFIAKNSDYQVFHNDAIQPTGYVLDISENVDVSNRVFNPKKILYQFDPAGFQPDTIEYQATDNSAESEIPLSGFAKIKTTLKMIRYENDKEVIISDKDPLKALEKINATVEEDFGEQLTFRIIYTKKDGTRKTFDNANIYQLTNLENGDEIKLTLVPKEEQLFFPLAPFPLVIKVQDLMNQSPSRNLLKFLRVRQDGLINGYGSFKLLLSDPTHTREVQDQLDANKWKFVIRVWDAKRRIKHNWTDNQAQLNNLSNGDRIEWKLVDQDGKNIRDAYYNTVAHNGSFAQVYYSNGNNSSKVIGDGIGAYPEKDTYPTNGGFVISGLKPAYQFFKIKQSGLQTLINSLNPKYIGLNGNGAITFLNHDYFDEKHYVDADGNVTTNPGLNLLNDNQTLKWIEINQLFEGITFYTDNPETESIGFKFKYDQINPNNKLSNGNQLWAKMDDTNNSLVSGNEKIIAQLPMVEDLKYEDPSNKLLWTTLGVSTGIVGIGASTIATILIRKHKLKK